MANKDYVAYVKWKNMKSRCYAPSYNDSKNKYQSLGIQVCKRWLNSFSNFLEDMGECPVGFSLERKNPLGDYEPSNCIWIPLVNQAKNRTSCKFYTLNGVTKTMKDWAREYKVPYTTLRHKLLVQNKTLLVALKEFKGILVQGVYYKTVTEACEKTGVSYSAVMTKKSRSVEEISYEEIFKHYLK